MSTRAGGQESNLRNPRSEAPSLRGVVAAALDDESLARKEAEGFREGLRLYWRLVGARSRGQMQYKLSFALQIVNAIVVTVVDFLEILVIFGRIPALAGWSLGEVALLYGMAATSFAVAEMFVRGFEMLSRHIVQGTFDRILTRPRGAFFQVFASDLALWKVGRLAQGVLILLVAQQYLTVHWSMDRLIVLGLGLASGAAIFFSIFVVGAASCFWTIQNNEVVNVFTNGGVMMASYPMEIFQGWMRRLITFVVPLAFVDYYPALYVLGRPDPLGLPSWVGWLSPVVAAGCALIAWGAWSLGVRHYQSTGS